MTGSTGRTRGYTQRASASKVMLESTTYPERLADLLDGIVDGSVVLPAYLSRRGCQGGLGSVGGLWAFGGAWARCGVEVCPRTPWLTWAIGPGWLRVGDMMCDGVFRQMVLRPLILSGPSARGWTKESRARRNRRGSVIRQQARQLPVVDHDYFALVVSVRDWDQRKDQLEAPGECGSPRPAAPTTWTQPAAPWSGDFSGRTPAFPPGCWNGGSVHRALDSPAE